MRHDRSDELFAEALELLPGGVSSPVRAFRAVGGSPLFIERGEGAYIVDVDGNRYVDYVLSWGPLVLGHAHPRVVAALERALREGTSFGAPSPLELELARLIREAMPSVELIRFVNSGTEATMSAVRLARAFTSRPKVVKFVGCYHGHPDLLLVRAGSGVATLGLPDSPGVTPGAVGDTLTAPYNDLDGVERLFDAHDDIAAVIVEPILGNAQAILPREGFHQEMRALTKEFGALLIFDEVKTGFRIAKGGSAEYFGVTPDLATYAKAIGNGYPAACFAGSDEVMSVLPDKVSHGGTYAGNRVAAAAAVATLKILRDTDSLGKIHQVGREVQAGLSEVISERGLPYVFTGHPAMFGIMFTESAPTEYRDWANSDHDLYDAVAMGMHARGAMPEPDSREPWFFCEAHAGEDVVDRIVTIFADSLDAALEARSQGAEKHVGASQWSMAGQPGIPTG